MKTSYNKLLKMIIGHFMKLLILIAVLVVSGAAFAEEGALIDSSYAHRSARVEAGFGIGDAGEGGGLSGRLAISYITNKWGAVARISAFDGAEASRRGWFGRPREIFNDKAILLSRVISNKTSGQIIASAGIGWMNGRKLNEKGTGLIDAGPDAGFAFELGIASTGSTVGLGMSLIGNLNSETNLFGVILSITLGDQK